MHAHASATLWALMASIDITAAGCGMPRPQPSIEFTSVPPAAEGGPDRLAPVAGRVTGARPGRQVVLFAKSGVWFVQPYRDQPFTKIAADSTWENTSHLGWEYAALLVSADYRPPSTVDPLPQPGGGVIAVATTKGVREPTAGAAIQPKTVSFSGYDWEIRQTPSDRGGLNHYDPGNVWVDSDRHLHLSLTRRAGVWTGSEVTLSHPLGYGTYLFVVRDSADLDPAATLDLFTWDAAGAVENFRELGIELGRWGAPRSANAQYVVQPHILASNVARFDAPPGRLTHALRWTAGRAAFWTTRGTNLPPGPSVAEHEFTTGVPTPGTARVYMSVFWFRKAPLPPQREVEVVIDKFQYLP
jgi:hypothetical protein